MTLYVVIHYVLLCYQSQEYQGADGTRLDDADAEGDGGEQRLPSHLQEGMLCRVASAKLYKGATSEPGYGSA